MVNLDDNLTQLCSECQRERADFRAGKTRVSPACVELFRRAIANDHAAWNAIFDQVFAQEIHQYVQAFHQEYITQRGFAPFDREDAEQEVNAAFSGNWNYSWGDSKSSSADIGTSVGRTCFLTGIGNNIYDFYLRVSERSSPIPGQIEAFYTANNNGLVRITATGSATILYSGNVGWVTVDDVNIFISVVTQLPCPPNQFCSHTVAMYRRSLNAPVNGSWDLIVAQGSGSNLRSDGQFVYFMPLDGIPPNPTGIAKVPTNAPPVQIDLEALDLDVTQAIQDMKESFALVACTSEAATRFFRHHVVFKPPLAQLCLLADFENVIPNFGAGALVMAADATTPLVASELLYVGGDLDFAADTAAFTTVYRLPDGVAPPSKVAQSLQVQKVALLASRAIATGDASAHDAGNAVIRQLNANDTILGETVALTKEFSIHIG